MKKGVLGLNNVGKSYLLSKMVHVEIPTGHSIETKGISIKYSEIEKGEEKGICILDSAGFETPLLIKRNNDKKEDDNGNEIGKRQETIGENEKEKDD